MADFQVDSSELATFARQLGAVASELADLEGPNTEAGRVVLEAARPATPMATGNLSNTLVADVSANGVAFASSARYWTFVHWGAPRRNMRARPFYLEAVEADTDRIVAVYSDHATDVLTRNLT